MLSSDNTCMLIHRSLHLNRVHSLRLLCKQSIALPLPKHCMMETSFLIIAFYKQYGYFIFLSLQLHHYIYIWNTFCNTPGFYNKLSVLFKGPGWGPGKPRLGLLQDIPEVHNFMPYFSPTNNISITLQLYAHVFCCKLIISG